MSSPLKHLFSLCLLIVAFILLISLTSGDASATPDSNNDLFGAVTLSNNVPAAGSLSEIDDVSDFYRVLVSPGDVLDVGLTMQPGTDLDIYLYDPGQNLVTSSEIDNVGSGVFTESVTITLYAPGHYFIEVRCYSGSGSFTVRASTTAEWTVMVYLDADNNLEAAGITDFMEMSSVGSTSEVNLLVQFDRISGEDSTYGDWTGTNRYLVTSGMTPTAANAVSSLGEVNMGDPFNLANFINWGIDNYPANRYMLVLWDHGGNWQGVCWDDTDGDNLAVLETRIAFDMVRGTHPGVSFDVIGFDACVMSGIEVLYEISGYTEQIIASQLNEPGPGWNYQLMCSAITTNPYINASAISQQIAQTYVDSYSVPYYGYFQTDVTMAVIDASGVPAIVTALDQVAADMLNGILSKHNYYRTAWEASAKTYYDYPDLLDLSYHLSIRSPTALERQHALALYNATMAAIVLYDHYDAVGGDETGSLNGISVYFPEPGYFNNAYRTSGTLFSALGWDEMLVNYYSSIVQPNDPVGIVSRSPASDPSVAVGSSQIFTVTIDDSDPDTILYLWTWDGHDLPVSSSVISIDPNASHIGVHTLQVQVSDGASFASTTWTVTVLEKPDLCVTGLLKWDSQENPVDNITSGRTTFAGALVSNQGSTTCSFNATCYLDGVPFCSWSLVELAPGGTVLLTSFPFSLSEVGVHSIRFLVDPLNTVDESNESNNDVSFVLNVVPAEWTVLVYMDGDNNLEMYFLDNFLQMSDIGSDGNVSVVVQFDRIDGYDSRYGDWTDCLRFYVERGMTPTEDNATDDLGEVNMGSGAILEEFLLWGTSTFQAERYVVVLKDHGNSWYGCCFDDTSSGDRLSIYEMSDAFYWMTVQMGRGVDLLVLDDCLMGSLEVAMEMSPHADFAVVSETIGWTSNHDYSSILSFLASDTEMGGEELAMGILQRMVLVDDEEHVTQCAAAYDLREMSGLTLAFNEFVDDLGQVWMDDAGVLEAIRLEISHFHAVHGNDTIDMRDFVELCMQSSPELQPSGTAVLQNLSSPGGVVLGYRYTDTVDHCHGMSLYFPWQVDDYVTLYTDCAYFASESLWDDLLLEYLTESAPLTLGYVHGTGGTNGWYVSNVEVTLQVYDPTDMGYDTYYTLNGTYVPYTGPFDLNGDGEYGVLYYSVGANAAVEELRGGAVKVDATKPTVEAALDGYSLTLTAYDATSGVSSVLYSVDGGPWIAYTGPFVVGPVGHMYSVRYHAVDVAGNVGTDEAIIVGDSDDIAPVSSAEISGTSGSNGWYVSSVSITLSATDEGGSGLQNVTYSLDGGAWAAYSSPVTCASEGEHTLNYRAKDNFGNEEAVRELSFKIDLGAPLTNALMNRTAHNGWFSSAVSAALSANDPVSGVSVLSYRVNGGNWSAYSNDIDISSDGTWFIEWKVTDNAGNVGTGNVTIRMDTTAPTVSCELTGFTEDGWGIGSSTVEWFANDTGSGVMNVYYRVHLGEWTLYSGALSFNATGAYLVECYAVDTANNSGPVSNVSVWMDVSAPVTTLSLSGITYEEQYLNAATVGCEITDHGIGGTVLWYRVGDGNWTEFEDTLALDAGTYVLWYYSADALDNREETRSVNFTVIDASVPGQVMTLAVWIEDGNVWLSWAAPDDGVLPITSFLVYRSIDGGDMEPLTTVNGTSYIDEDVSEGSSYSYRLVAENLLGQGTASAAVTAVMPEPSSGIDPMVLVAIAMIGLVVVAAAALFIRRR